MIGADGYIFDPSSVEKNGRAPRLPDPGNGASDVGTDIRRIPWWSHRLFGLAWESSTPHAINLYVQFVNYPHCLDFSLKSCHPLSISVCL